MKTLQLALLLSLGLIPFSAWPDELDTLVKDEVINTHEANKIRAREQINPDQWQRLNLKAQEIENKKLPPEKQKHDKFQGVNSVETNSAEYQRVMKTINGP